MAQRHPPLELNHSYLQIRGVATPAEMRCYALQHGQKVALTELMAKTHLGLGWQRPYPNTLCQSNILSAAGHHFANARDNQ